MKAVQPSQLVNPLDDHGNFGSNPQVALPWLDRLYHRTDLRALGVGGCVCTCGGCRNSWPSRLMWYLCAFVKKHVKKISPRSWSYKMMGNWRVIYGIRKNGKIESCLVGSFLMTQLALVTEEANLVSFNILIFWNCPRRSLCCFLRIHFFLKEVSIIPFHFSHEYPWSL